NIYFEGTNSGNISYIYNAIGGKVKKVVEDNVSHITTTTDYLSGFQYKNATLQFFPHAEGYVHYTKPLAAQGGANSALGAFNYVFNYTDHLGNVRLSYARDPLVRNRVRILEENHYYAFGLKHKNYNVEKLNFEKFPETGVEIVPAPAVSNASYNYKYNGKELQEELGLNMYDYGARNYDPALGRWMNIDPLAETSRRWNPYNYCYNNPMTFVDPDGMQAEKIIVKINEKNSEGDEVETDLEYKNGKLYSGDGKEYKGSNSYASKVLEDLNEIKNSGDSEMVNRLDKLEKSENEHFIKDVENDAEGNSNTGDYAISQRLGISTGSTTEYDPTRTKNVGGEVRDPVIALVHELLGHGYDNEMGTWTSDVTKNGIKMNEVNAVNIENRMRAVKGENKRTTYGKTNGRWNKIPSELLD
ncbi:RHS repeat-associated core domain-containing protein, partial [Flavobacterium sp.]|uniref:RHS repeat-associated core domain-containing protein n=1 Tax=Flavobacterium sp. TaxID=239 RepID=UPI0037C095F7